MDEKDVQVMIERSYDQGKLVALEILREKVIEGGLSYEQGEALDDIDQMITEVLNAPR